MTEVNLSRLIEEAGEEVLTPVPIRDYDQMDGADEWGEFDDGRYGRVVSGTSTPSLHYIDESGLRGELDVLGRVQRKVGQEIASVVEKWSQGLSGVTEQRSIDVFNRRRWDGKHHMFAQMSLCAWAVENDDILSTLCDVVEGLMFQKCRFELFDTDQQSIWNQWAAEVNFDGFLRKFQRELFKVSQLYVGLWWENVVYTVEDDPIQATIEEMEAKREQREYEDRVKERQRYIDTYSRTPGYIEPPELPEPEKPSRRGNRARKKKYPLRVPTQMTIFDPTKVVPVGTLMFGRERFAYVASRGEDEAFSSVMRGDAVDGTVLQLIESKYAPTEQDKAALQELGIDPNRLWLLKQDAVFRHTLTKADYERFATVRLKSVLELLEMKAHLRAADRAALIGNTNFIVVITKGSDKLPAKPSEIANLQEQARIIARLPVLVGDHRLQVNIVAPPIDHTLQDSRYQVLDQRLVFKALNTYSPTTQGGNSSGSGVSEMSRVVATGLQNRRHMIVRTIEKEIFRAIMRKNEGVPDFDEFPSLVFSPKKITLDVSADILGQVLKLRDRGDISRETTLEELDFDQDVEVLRRARERVDYDRVFESSTPFSSPSANPYGTPAAPPSRSPAGQGQPSGPDGGIPQQPSGAQPGSNVAPSGQPRTEGGRPSGVTETQPRNPRGSGGRTAKS
ncbi:MAG: hypothetical protein HOV97_05140 [Nonomuraea sp.]|nr:hypothetical protein [Nonomuraea sp.]